MSKIEIVSRNEKYIDAIRFTYANCQTDSPQPTIFNALNEIGKHPKQGLKIKQISRQWIGDPPLNGPRCCFTYNIQEGYVNGIQASSKHERISVIKLVRPSPPMTYVIGNYNSKAQQVCEERLLDDEFIVGCYGYLTKIPAEDGSKKEASILQGLGFIAAKVVQF